MYIIYRYITHMKLATYDRLVIARVHKPVAIIESGRALKYDLGNTYKPD